MNESSTWFLDNVINETYSYYENVFSDEEIDDIISLCETYPVADAMIYEKENEKVVDKQFRETEISWVTPSTKSEWLYRKLTDVIIGANSNYFGFDLMFMESLQYTVYKKGGFYKEHVDMMYSSPGAPRKLSFSMQLVDEKNYKGGDLVLKTGRDSIVPKKKGTITFFPSYVLHEVTPVTSGTRKALVGWVSGPSFR